jgi:hypothetical protein
MIGPMSDHIITPVGYVIGLVRIVGSILCLFWMARTVVKPDPLEHLRWYDRILRGIGVLILGSLILFGIPHWFGWVK